MGLRGIGLLKWSPVLQYLPHTAFCDAPSFLTKARGRTTQRLTFLSRESKSYGVFWFRWAISLIDQYTETQTSPNTLSTILGGQMTVLVQDTDLPPSTNRDRPHQYLYNQPRHRQRFFYVSTSSSTAEIEGGEVLARGGTRSCPPWMRAQGGSGWSNLQRRVAQTLYRTISIFFFSPGLWRHIKSMH